MKSTTKLALLAIIMLLALSALACSEGDNIQGAGAQIVETAADAAMDGIDSIGDAVCSTSPDDCAPNSGYQHASDVWNEALGR